LKRQELAGHPDFEPAKVFDTLNVDKSGSLDVAQFMEFFKKQYINPEQRVVEAMINEFDGEQRKSLGFEEFCQMVLPAANSGLRSLAVGRRDSPYFRPHAPLPYEVISLLVRLLDKELSFHRQRADALEALAKHDDFDRRKIFEAIARGYHSICMPDLIVFLEKNGFYPRREDIEAILRRLDHDANKMLSFEEFCEVVGPEPNNGDDDEESKDAHQFERTNESPLRKALEEQVDSEANDEPTQSLSTP
jgi:Ca2+-binding EF-hand superfamily protein